MSSRRVSVVVIALSLVWGTAALAENNEAAAITVRARGNSGEIVRTRKVDADGVDRSLPAQLDGGVISRSALKAETARGIGLFLQQVRVEAVVSHRRFVGWRLTALFPKREDVRVQGLKVGDIVLRVNGQSVERPEDFKAIWDGLERSSELIIEIERAGEAASVRYAIR